MTEQGKNSTAGKVPDRVERLSDSGEYLVVHDRPTGWTTVHSLGQGAFGDQLPIFIAPFEGSTVGHEAVDTQAAGQPADAEQPQTPDLPQLPRRES